MRRHSSRERGHAARIWWFCGLAGCLRARPSWEERLIFLDGQVHHGAHTAIMGNYAIKVEIT